MWTFRKSLLRCLLWALTVQSSASTCLMTSLLSVLVRDRFASKVAVQHANTSSGSVTNPHGVKGLENCHFLKDIRDARLIRNQVNSNLERASLPTTSDAERRRLLSFVVSGGGPTGVEFAAELYDMLNEDLTRYYPRILRNEISVHVIQSRSHILNTYDEALSKYAEVCNAIIGDLVAILILYRLVSLMTPSTSSSTPVSRKSNQTKSSSRKPTTKAS